MGKLLTKAKDIKTQERRKVVLQLRKEGNTYQGIVDAVLDQFDESDLPNNYDQRQAYQDVKRELDKLRCDVAETAEEIKSIEIQRLERIFNMHFKKAEKDTRSADICLKTHDKIMRLHGLDVTKIAMTDKDGEDLAERLIRTQSLDGDAINSLLKGSEVKE